MLPYAYMYKFAGTAIVGLDVHTMHVEYTHSDWLPSLCASAIDTRILVTDPLCYLKLRFVKRSFAKLYYVNLLGTFVGLVFCIQARFSHVKSKNRQTTT